MGPVLASVALGRHEVRERTRDDDSTSRTRPQQGFWRAFESLLWVGRDAGPAPDTFNSARLSGVADLPCARFRHQHLAPSHARSFVAKPLGG